MSASVAAAPATTPLLRSQTAAVLVPTWISSASVGAQSPSTTLAASPAGASGAPPPLALPSATSRHRGPMAMGLASWRSTAASVSPGTSPALGASSPPPPPPSYSATVSDGTRATSKKATVFCEIADAVYQSQLQQAEVLQQHNNSNGGKAGKEAVELPRIHLVRIAGLAPEDAKEKVLNAVTVACQTQLSEPTGRFFVFELPPANYELWPSQAVEHRDASAAPEGTKAGTRQQGRRSARETPLMSGQQQQQQQQQQHQESGDFPPEMELPSSLDVMQSSHIVCVLCPNASLCSAMHSKLENVFQQQQTQPPAKKVVVDVAHRLLPQSCCLVVKASNSANRNHEAEAVPWGDLMAAGAVSPETVAALSAAATAAAASAAAVNVTETAASGKRGAAKKAADAPAVPAAAAKKSPAVSAAASPPPPPSYTATVTTPTLGSSDPEGGSSSAVGRVPNGVAAPVVPSYFRLLRNERGVFRNALFLRFPSQAKAELAMMYLERLCLCGRRIRVEHKKHSRGTAAASSHLFATPGLDAVSPALDGAAAAATTAAPAVPTNQAMMDSHVAELNRKCYDGREGFSYPKRLLSKDDTRYLVELAAAHDLVVDAASSATHITVMRPRRAVSTASSSSAAASASSPGVGGGGGARPLASPALGAQTPPWAPQTPPLSAAPAYRAAAAAAAAGSGGGGSTTGSPGDGPANGSFSSSLAAGTMQFRGLRHWREARGQQAQAQQEKDDSGSPGQDGGGGPPPPMDLDAGAAFQQQQQRYVRALDPREAERRGIPPFSGGRGRRVQ